MVIVSTSAVRLTIDAATVPKISIAASGPPLIDCGTSSILVCLVDRDRAKRKGNAGQHTHKRDEPEART